MAVAVDSAIEGASPRSPVKGVRPRDPSVVSSDGALGAAANSPLPADLSSSPATERGGWTAPANSSPKTYSAPRRSHPNSPNLRPASPVQEWEFDHWWDLLTLGRIYFLSGGFEGVRARVHLAMEETRVINEYAVIASTTFNHLSPLARVYFALLEESAHVSPQRVQREWRRIACRYVRENWTEEGEQRLPSNLPPLFIPIPTKGDLLSDIRLFGNCVVPPSLQHDVDLLRVFERFRETMSQELEHSMSQLDIQSGETSILSLSFWLALQLTVLGGLMGEVIAAYIAAGSISWINVRWWFGVFVCSLLARHSAVPTWAKFRKMRVPALIVALISCMFGAFVCLGKAFSASTAGDGPPIPEGMWVFDADRATRFRRAVFFSWMCYYYVLPIEAMVLAAPFIIDTAHEIILATAHNFHIMGEGNTYRGWMLTVVPQTYLFTASTVAVITWFPARLIVWAIGALGKAYSSNDAGDGPVYPFQGPDMLCADTITTDFSFCYEEVLPGVFSRFGPAYLDEDLKLWETRFEINWGQNWAVMMILNMLACWGITAFYFVSMWFKKKPILASISDCHWTIQHTSLCIGLVGWVFSPISFWFYAIDSSGLIFGIDEMSVVPTLRAAFWEFEGGVLIASLVLLGFASCLSACALVFLFMMRLCAPDVPMSVQAGDSLEDQLEDYRDESSKDWRDSWGEQAGAVSVLMENIERYKFDFERYFGPLDSRKIEKRLESVIVFVIRLQRARDKTDMVLACVSLCHGLFDQAVSRMLVDAVRSLFNASDDKKALDMETQAGLEDVREYIAERAAKIKERSGDGISYTREKIKGWRELGASPFSKKLHEFFALCAFTGVMSHIGVELKMEKFKEYYKRTKLDESWSVSIYLQLVDNAMFILERVADFAEHRTLSSLMFSDSEAREMEGEYAFLKGNFSRWKNGALEKDRHEVDGRSVPKISDTEFKNRVFRLVEKMRVKNTSFKVDKLQSPERTVFVNRLADVERLNSEVLASMNEKVMRPAPFALVLAGNTGQGKSGVVTLISKVLSASYGIEYQEHLVVNINGKDKFQSEVKSSHVGIIIDDLANTKAEFVQVAPTDLIIDMINNVSKYVLKADVAEKGMVQYNNLFALATTNVPSLDAAKYSNEHAAVLRRFNFHILMRVRPEFAKPRTQANEIYLLDPSKMEDELIKDAWLFDVRVVRVCEPNPPVDHERPGISPCQSAFIPAVAKTSDEGEERPLTGINIHELNYVLGKACEVHRAQQDAFVERLEDLADAPLCSHYTLAHLCPQCHPAAPDVQGGTEAVLSSYDKWCALKSWCWIKFEWMNDLITKFAAIPYKEALKRCGLNQSHEGVAQWIMGCDSVMGGFIRHFWWHFAFMWVSSYFMWSVAFHTLLIGVGWWKTIMALSLYSTVLQARVIFLDVLRVFSRAKMYDVRKAVSQKALGYGACVVMMIGGLLLLRALLGSKKKDKSMEEQGGFFSMPEKDKIRKPDIWGVQVDRIPKLPPDARARNMTMVDMVSVVSRSQVFVRAQCGDSVRFGNGLFLKTNFLLIPYHFLLTKNGYAEKLHITFAAPDKTGPHFQVLVGPQVVVKVPDRDLAIVYTAKGGARKDLLELGAFSEDLVSMRSIGVTEIHRTREGELVSERYNASSCQYDDLDRPELELRHTYLAYAYSRLSPTFVGLCGSSLLTHISGGPCIIGFHLKGHTGAETGLACSISARMLREAILRLAARPLVHQAADVMLSVPYLPESYPLETPLEIRDHVDPKSVLNDLPAGSGIIAFGKHNQPRRSMRSQVALTPIAEAVAEECGVPISHGPPAGLGKLKVWLDNLTPCVGNYQFPHKNLQLAYLDAFEYITGVVKSNLSVFGGVKPYIMKVVTSGVSGVRGVNGLKMSTSMGWPWCRPKNQFLSRGPPEPPDYPDGVIEIPEEIMKDVEHLREEARAGRRFGTVFRACEKDEATKIGKDKVRIFTSSNILLSLLCRQYFLPIVRIILNYPLLFHTAVGMNCYGKDWVRLHGYVKMHGKDRTTAGDFEKFDKRLEYQVQILTFIILMEVGRIIGYSEDDLKVMNAIVEEICRAIWEFNGEFLEMETVNSSGHDLTVIINGLVNLIQTSYSFYSNIPEELALGPRQPNKTAEYFREVMPDLNWDVIDELDNKPLVPGLNGRFCYYVALITLGDDNAFSVSEECSWFDHMVMSKALADVGLSYTTADKQVPTEPFEGMDRVTFLKRSFVHHSDLGRVVGPIEEASIFKSLFCWKPSSGVPWEMHCSDQINGALREFALYGRGTFDKRRAELVRVAEKLGIMHYFPGGKPFTYEEMMEWFGDPAMDL